jgi:hypothetical protein
MVCICHYSYTGSINRRNKVQLDLGIDAKPYLKNNESERTGSMAPLVEYLSS